MPKNEPRSALQDRRFGGLERMCASGPDVIRNLGQAESVVHARAEVVAEREQHRVAGRPAGQRYADLARILARRAAHRPLPDDHRVAVGVLERFDGVDQRGVQ